MTFPNLEFISLSIIKSTQIKPLRQPSCTFYFILQVCGHHSIMFSTCFRDTGVVRGRTGFPLIYNRDPLRTVCNVIASPLYSDPTYWQRDLKLVFCERSEHACRKRNRNIGSKGQKEPGKSILYVHQATLLGLGMCYFTWAP